MASNVDNRILNSKGQSPSQFISELAKVLRLTIDQNTTRTPEEAKKLQITLEIAILRQLCDQEWKLIPVQK